MSECRVSHVTVEQEDTETRCVPAYDTRGRRVRRAGRRRQCGLEHGADCGQVMVQVDINWETLWQEISLV